MALVWAWAEIDRASGLLGYSTRGAVFLLVAVLVGYYAERLGRDTAQHRRRGPGWPCTRLRSRSLELS